MPMRHPSCIVGHPAEDPQVCAMCSMFPTDPMCRLGKREVESDDDDVVDVWVLCSSISTTTTITATVAAYGSASSPNFIVYGMYFIVDI